MEASCVCRRRGISLCDRVWAFTELAGYNGIPGHNAPNVPSDGPMNEHHPVPRTCTTCGRALRAAAPGGCPACDALSSDAGGAINQPGFLSLPQMRYPNAYTWLVLVSALDLILTSLVVYLWNGYEANPVAAAVIDAMGYVWAVVFKFAIVVFVILICEGIGRRSDRDGRALAGGAVVISGIPVAYTLGLLLLAGPAPVG